MLAPGTILQQMYLSERLRRRWTAPGRFVELGAGTGYISSVLLAHGWQGLGVDLNESACEKNRATNVQSISAGSYTVRNVDFLATDDLGAADMVISSMVLEHLDEAATQRFFDVIRSVLRPNGDLVLMVPGSPEHWGIEDEVAGHIQRFDRPSLVDELSDHHFRADHVAGLTYPMSNILLPISNRLVRRTESSRVALSQHDRTVLAGDRQVPFKTSYPKALRWMLNPVTMYPFHVLQKAFRDRPGALVLYAEARRTITDGA